MSIAHKTRRSFIASIIYDFASGAKTKIKLAHCRSEFHLQAVQSIDELLPRKRGTPNLAQRDWTFAADTGQRTPEGQPVWVKLVYAGDTKIKRHIKIRQDANPFDSQWRSYFQERAFYKKFGIHRRQAGIEPS